MSYLDTCNYLINGYNDYICNIGGGRTEEYKKRIEMLNIEITKEIEWKKKKGV